MKKNNLTILLLLLNAVLLIGIIFLLALNYFKDSGETKERSSSQSVVAKKEVTPKLLQKKLDAQAVSIQSGKYIEQRGELNTLYPDLLSAIVKNNSDKEIKRIMIGFVAWDEEGNPVKLKANFDIHKDYYFPAESDELSMKPGDEYGRKNGLPLDEKVKVASFKAIVEQYEDVDGKIWDNPELREFKKMYVGKKLSEIENADKYIYE